MVTIFGGSAGRHERATFVPIHACMYKAVCVRILMYVSAYTRAHVHACVWRHVNNINQPRACKALTSYIGIHNYNWYLKFQAANDHAFRERTRCTPKRVLSKKK